MSKDNTAEVTQQTPPDINPTEKPELDAAMAGWLVQKLDCAVELNGHEDRNNFAAVINRLIAIANWKAPE